MIKFDYHLKINHMKGISYITDDHNKKKAVIIDYSLFKKHSEALEDMLDTIIAEARAEEESIPFEKVVTQLKKKGKL
jgi:hypothetical protein